MHEQEFAHNDVKIDNVLVELLGTAGKDDSRGSSPNRTVKFLLADFGFVQKQDASLGQVSLMLKSFISTPFIQVFFTPNPRYQGGTRSYDSPHKKASMLFSMLPPDKSSQDNLWIQNEFLRVYKYYDCYSSDIWAIGIIL